MVKITGYELDFSNATANIDFEFECSPEDEEKIGDEGIYVMTDFYDEEDPIPDIYDDLEKLEDEFGVEIELPSDIVEDIENEIRDQLEEWDLEEQGEREDYYRAIGLW